MSTSIVVAIMVTCAVLFALYLITGTLVPFCVIHGHAEDEVLEGHVLYQAADGCLVRLKDESLCWVNTPKEPETDVLVTFSSGLKDGEFDPDQSCSFNRAVLVKNGQKALVLRRITEDTVLCQIGDEPFLVECSVQEQTKKQKLDEEGHLSLFVKKEGVRMLPLAALV